MTAAADSAPAPDRPPFNGANPDGPVRQLPFGGLGMITYLILDDQQRVDLLIVTWAG